MRSRTPVVCLSHCPHGGRGFGILVCFTRQPCIVLRAPSVLRCACWFRSAFIVVVWKVDAGLKPLVEATGLSVATLTASTPASSSSETLTKSVFFGLGGELKQSACRVFSVSDPTEAFLGLLAMGRLCSVLFCVDIGWEAIVCGTACRTLDTSSSGARLDSEDSDRLSECPVTRVVGPGVSEKDLPAPLKKLVIAPCPAARGFSFLPCKELSSTLRA